MLNLEWLRTFKTIYNEKTLTAAAQQLHMSQPGVSVHLSALENYVGAKLFERQSKKMIPTEQGKALYNQVLDPLAELLKIEHELMQGKKGENSTLTVGICMEGFSLALEKHIHTLSFNIVHRFSEDEVLLSELEKGISDIAFVSTHRSIPGIKYEFLGDDNILLVGNKNIDSTPIKEAFLSDDKTKLEEVLKEQKWFGVSNNDEYFSRFWKHHFGAKHRIKFSSIVPNYNSMLNSLKYGKGVAVVTGFIAAEALKNDEVQLLWKGDKSTLIKSYIAYRKKSVHKTQIVELLNLFK